MSLDYLIEGFLQRSLLIFFGSGILLLRGC